MYSACHGSGTDLHMSIVSRNVYLCRSNGTDAQVSQAKYESLYQGPKGGLTEARCLEP